MLRSVAMRRIRVATVFLMMVLAVTGASALNGVSRACQFNQIPSPIRGPAIRLFNYVSTAPWGKFDGLIYMSEAELAKYWILESITTDYLSTRYYLYAENRVYRSVYGPTGILEKFTLYANYSSPGWTAESVPADAQSDSYLDIFFHNRGILTSARAGNPEVIANIVPLTRFGDLFFVYGNHYYYDSVNKTQSRIGLSAARDCNLSQWGFGDR